MNDQPRRSSARNKLFAGYGGDTQSQRRHKPDYWLLILTSLLLVLGLVVVYSISPALATVQGVSQSYFVTKQILDVLLGVMAFGIAAYIPLKTWRGLIQPLMVVAVIGCLAVLVMPINAEYPAHRWIRLGSFSFQIAELIKLVLMLWLAAFLSLRSREGALANHKKTFQPLLILIGLVGIVVAKMQSDLGSAGVMIAMIVGVAFVAGVPLKRLAMIGGAVLILVAAAISTSSYRRERLATFLHPGKDCKASSYQVCQALISVGSGGIVGQGLGYGVQAYGYQPEAANDSIFAIIAEKFGFLGTTTLVVLFGVLFSRLKQIAERSSDLFNKLVVVGALMWISTQMAINVGAMIGVFPLKGITLPLISQGGTSLVFLTAALGIVFQISRYTSYSVSAAGKNSENQPSDSPNRRGLRRAYNPPVVARPRT